MNNDNNNQPNLNNQSTDNKIESLDIDELSSPINASNPDNLMAATSLNNLNEVNQNNLEENLNTESNLNQTTMNDSNVAPTVPNDNFNAVPTPPVFENTEKPKKNKNKTLIVLLLIIIILGIGFGLYYFLVLAKNNNISTNLLITPKEVHIELLEDLPTDVSEYADIIGTDPSVCTVNTDEIDNKTINRYNFTVTCGTESKSGIAVVDDTISPDLILNDLEILVGTMPKAEDFVNYCIDASTCTYKINTDLSSMINTPGEYEVEIEVTDARGNALTSVAKLTVGATVASSYVTCTATPKEIDEIYGTQKITYKIGVTSDNKFYNATRLDYFTFENKDDYKTQSNNYNSNDGINGVTGTTYFDNTNKTIIIKNNKTFEELLADNGNTGTVSNDIFVLRAYLTFNGYTCE